MRTRRTRKRRKKNGKRAAILAAIALSLGALTVWATRRQPQADTASLSTETINSFAYRTACGLLRSRGENLIYSPVSFYHALSLTASGASGQTAGELDAYLGVQDGEKPSEQAASLYRTLHSEGEHSRLTICTSLWHDQSVRLKRGFKKEATKQYGASVYSADFGSDAAADKMNEWVQQQTGGTIRPEIRVQEDDLLRILNTLYFRDEWRDRLYLSETPEPFYLTGGETADALFLNKTYGSWGFYKGAGFTRASLVLKERGQMYFVLPDEGVPVDSFFESAERLQEVMEGGTSMSGEVVFKIPQFTLSSSLDLKESMVNDGITDPFVQGDFSNMTKDGEVRISAITQDSYISVNRDGVEASSFTDLTLESAAAIKEKADRADMILNRPFLFGIKNRGVWLLIGVCDHPAA